MCNFLSAIILRDGTVLCNPLTDSHSRLIEHFCDQHPCLLNDAPVNEDRAAFIRVEFEPPTNSKGVKQYGDVVAYKLRVDESFTPGWFDDDLRAQTITRLAAVITGLLVRGKRKSLLGGTWILLDDADVVCAEQCRIIACVGKSKVETLSRANVGVMWGSSNVGVMRGSSNVGEMWGSSNVGVMWESSNVGVMRESSNVGVMWGSSKAPNAPKTDARKAVSR